MRAAMWLAAFLTAVGLVAARILHHARGEVMYEAAPRTAASSARVVAELGRQLLVEGQTVVFEVCSGDGFPDALWRDRAVFEVWHRDAGERVGAWPLDEARLTNARRGARGACVMVARTTQRLLGVGGAYAIALAPGADARAGHPGSAPRAHRRAAADGADGPRGAGARGFRGVVMGAGARDAAAAAGGVGDGGSGSAEPGAAERAPAAARAGGDRARLGDRGVLRHGVPAGARPAGGDRGRRAPRGGADRLRALAREAGRAPDPWPAAGAGALAPRARISSRWRPPSGCS